MSDYVHIPRWNNRSHLDMFEWKEDEGWDDIVKKYKVISYDSFSDFIEEDDEKLKFVYPYSVTVYEFPEFFLVAQWEINSFEDMNSCVTLSKNHFYIVEFYKEMCLPFIINKNKGFN